MQNPTSSHSRSTSGSPKTCCAQPSFGAPTPHQLTLLSLSCCMRICTISCGTARPTRSPSRSASRSGSGSPVVAISALPPIEVTKSFSHSGECVSASSEPSSIIARRACASL
jgi:hypothetical protein